MTLPTITTRVAFTTAPMAAAPTWATLAGLEVMAISTRRGRLHQLDRIEAGSATIVLNNDSGKYWPNNASGPYYGYIKPGKKVNLRATYGATTYDFFTGFIEQWTPSFDAPGGKAPIITITAYDGQRNLAGYLLNNAGEAAELFGARVGNVLDELGWPAADRTLDTGQTTMKATGAQVDVNAMAHLFTVQESEFGIVFQGPDGYMVAQDRHARLKSPYTTSQATFGDDPTEQSYVDLIPDMDAKDILNDVRITRDGGTEQAAADATSQTDYGKRSLSRTGLLMPSDAEALAQAQYILSVYKDSHLRVKAIAIRPAGHPGALFPKILSYDISTRITLRLDAAGIDADYHIEGISHDIDARAGTWETRWELSDANSQAYWILDTSVLDTDTRLAY